ncbi:hypothetical protein XELAEV_18019418mg, partial [Xenopus laevis]
NLQEFKFIYFSTILMFYFMTITGNLTIILLILTIERLKAPMYYFLSHLSLCDILITTTVVPKLLNIFYFFGVSTVTECFLLTVMSFDRYLAICNPLRYHSIMSFKLRLHLVLWSWLISFVISLDLTLLLNQLDFCNNNEIDHFFCDFQPILERSCSDTYIVKMEDFVLEDMNLAVVFMYYGTVIIIYIVPSRGSLKHVSKLLSLLYTVMTQLFNPIIYSIRNKEIR